MSQPRPTTRRLGHPPIRHLAGVLVAALLIAGPGHAQGLAPGLAPGPAPAPAQTALPDAFTAAQRAEIVQIVRDALKTDPSILGDAITALRASAQQTEAAETQAAIHANHADLAGHTGDAILGNPNGDVTVVEFYDPRCPYCRREIPDLDALLGSDHRVRLVEKLIPILGPNSVLDAEAIQAAAAQGKYAALQRALMGDSGAPGIDRIRAIAARTGLDVDRLVHDMGTPAVAGVLQSNMALAHTLHLTGTPTFIVGDQAIEGAADAGDLHRAIQSARGA